MLIGALIPTELSVYVGGVRFTPGRVAVLLLLAPAVVALIRRRGRLLLPDLPIVATAAWMIGAALATAGFQDFSSAFAEAIELLGAYIVARAFIYGDKALRDFINVLKLVVLLVVLVAIVDVLFNQWELRDFISSVFHTPPMTPILRNDRIRAISTLDHPILLGAFCCVAAIVFMFSESGFRRLWLMGICTLGIVLSTSAAPALSLIIAAGIYVYDKMLQNAPWRWYLLWLFIFGLVGSSVLVSNDPVAWIVGHLTFEPESGYYRMQIWDAATSKISESPLFGFGFQPLNISILDNTVDSVWLVYALRFGVPMIALFLIANLAAVVGNRSKPTQHFRTDKTANMQTAFSLILAMFALMGLTVHFWNFMWIFWGMCIGIRASQREFCVAPVQQNAR